LHEYHKARSRSEVHILKEKRGVIGGAFRRELELQGYVVLAVAVAKVHLHALVELPHELETVKKIVGDAKKTASCMVTSSMPGEIWAEGGKYKPVMTKAHCDTAHDYIIYDQGPEAWTWSFRDNSDLGQFGRHCPNASGKCGPQDRKVPGEQNNPGRR
jgi:hypothetical protein